MLQDMRNNKGTKAAIAEVYQFEVLYLLPRLDHLQAGTPQFLNAH